MDNKDKYLHKNDKNDINDNNKKINILINEFIVKINDIDKIHNTLYNKLKFIDLLIDNLIDYCVKKKIFYYIENKISYTNIVNNFKTHLITFIKNLVDPNDNIVNKYINKINNDNLTNNWDNVSDINSILFKNFKNLNESFDKNVSFKESNITITNYDHEFDGFEYNYSNIKDGTINDNLIKLSEDFDNNDNDNNVDFNNDTDFNNYNDDNNYNLNINNNLPLYIKLLVNQNKYVLEFIDKLSFMCKILCDPEKKYKKSNPFD